MSGVNNLVCLLLSGAQTNRASSICGSFLPPSSSDMSYNSVAWGGGKGEGGHHCSDQTDRDRHTCPPSLPPPPLARSAYRGIAPQNAVYELVLSKIGGL
jgi:hypothetical protein